MCSIDAAILHRLKIVSEMNLKSTLSEEGVSPSPQTTVATALDRAAQLNRAGKFRDAATELESALTAARATPYEIEFQTRVRLGMALSATYVSLEQLEDARALLADEVAFAEKISQIMQATGTPTQKRAASAGYLQLRDRATQLALIGEVAPALSVTTWINGGPLTLAELRGRVVLLEFWATWCQPCQEMFPKLKKLYQQAGPRGLEIIALTRHFLAYGAPEESTQDELNLMRAAVSEHEPGFPVGVAPDEKLQAIYGANGLPTCFLIDRDGVVRYAGHQVEDAAFDVALEQCLKRS